MWQSSWVFIAFLAEHQSLLPFTVPNLPICLHQSLPFCFHKIRKYKDNHEFSSLEIWSLRGVLQIVTTHTYFFRIVEEGLRPELDWAVCLVPIYFSFFYLLLMSNINCIMLILMFRLGWRICCCLLQIFLNFIISKKKFVIQFSIILVRKKAVYFSSHAVRLLPRDSAEPALIEVTDDFLIMEVNRLFSELVLPHPTQGFNIINLFSCLKILFSFLIVP